MTWLLGKLGLSMLPGRSLAPLIAVAAVALGIVAGTMFAIHHYTRKGYDQAALECASARTAAQLRVKDLEAGAADDLRDNAIRQALSRQQLATGAAQQRQEVIDDAKANPGQPDCVLSDRGLRLWNADPGPAAGAVPVRPADPRQDPGGIQEPAPGGSGRPLIAPSESRGLETRSPGSGDRRAVAGEGSGHLQDAAGQGSSAARQQQARSTH